MVYNKKEQNLTANQQEILNKFILYFMPKRGNKRKHSGNEIEYVHQSIDRVFSKFFGFRLSRKQLLTTFEELQYDIFTKNSDWESNLKELKPSSKGIVIRLDEGYTDYNAAFIYIDIEPATARLLRVATAGLPPNAGQEKRQEKEIIVEKINLFKQTVKDKLTDNAYSL